MFKDRRARRAELPIYIFGDLQAPIMAHNCLMTFNVSEMRCIFELQQFGFKKEIFLFWEIASIFDTLSVGLKVTNTENIYIGIWLREMRPASL